MAMVKQSRNFAFKRAEVLPLERPRVVLVAVIWLYVIAALTFVGLASRNAIAAACCSFFIFSMAFALQRGFGWVRILLSAIIGLSWILLCLDNAISGLFIILIWGCPIILVWLPKSSAWFRDQKYERKIAILNVNETVMLHGSIVCIVLLAMIALICLYLSGVGQFLMWDYQTKFCAYSLREIPWTAKQFPGFRWAKGFVGLIPGFGLSTGLSFVGSIFKEDMPFWLGAVDLLLRLVGVGCVFLVWNKAKKSFKGLNNEHR